MAAVVLMAPVFVHAQGRTPTAPAAPSKVCHFYCVEQYNIWSGTRAGGGACSCMLNRTRPVQPQTATADNAHACSADSDCVQHCNAVCGSQGARCFTGASVTPPACGGISPPAGCSLVGSGVGPGAGDLNGATPSCATLAATGQGRSGGSSGGSSSRGTSVVLHNPLGDGTTLTSLAARVIKGVIGIVGSIALLMFVYGGIRYMTSGGSDEGVKEAKSVIKNATIGLLLIFFSYTIISIFLSALNQPIAPPATNQTPRAPAAPVTPPT